jgi:hypothetical protein
MAEVKIKELTTQKDKVFFPGTANLSESAAEAYKNEVKAAEESGSDESEDKQTGKRKKAE